MTCPLYTQRLRQLCDAERYEKVFHDILKKLQQPFGFSVGMWVVDEAGCVMNAIVLKCLNSFDSY